MQEKSRKLLTLLGLGAACAVCCAPLVLPLFAGAGLLGVGASAGGFAFGLTADQAICGGVAVAALAGLVFYVMRERRKMKAASCGCETTCDPVACNPDQTRKAGVLHG